MKSFLARLFGGPSRAALATAHEAAEIARLEAIANEPPPPGDGWRMGDQDSEGKWTVWRGPRKMAAFWDENDAAEWARTMNTDATPNRQLSDSHYCVVCGSRETSESIKARGYVACCPERLFIPQLWHVSDGPLATGLWHLWRPDQDLPSLERDGYKTQFEAQVEADNRNMAAFNRARRDHKSQALAQFLDVPIPPGVKLVVGPLPSPDNGLWYTFNTRGPYRGYIRKKNAQAAADRANQHA